MTGSRSSHQPMSNREARGWWLTRSCRKRRLKNCGRDDFVSRYRVRAFGPRLFWPDDLPKSKLEILEPDQVLPGGVVALYDGRGRLETPLWLPEQRTIVFGDALTERAGVLRVWSSPWHEKRALPALRELLKLPFEHVIISHGDHEPVHDRAAYERALKLPPWTG